MCVAQDLAQYVNEVKRDNETLREIDQYQKSIENLVSSNHHPHHLHLNPQTRNVTYFSLPNVSLQNQPLVSFGRPKGDGEVRMVPHFDKRKQDR